MEVLCTSCGSWVAKTALSLKDMMMVPDPASGQYFATFWCNPCTSSTITKAQSTL